MSPAMRGHAAMLLFSTLVAGSFSFGSTIANEIPPAALNAVRFAIAAALLLPVALLTTGFPKGWMAAPWRYVLIGGLFACYFVTMLSGLKTAQPVSAASVFTLVPFMAAGFAWLLLRQVTTPRMALALWIGAVCALWVIFRGDISAALGFEIGVGERIFFIGCIAHGIYTPMVRKLNRGEPPIVFSFGMLLAGMTWLAVYGWSDLITVPWTSLGSDIWIGLLYLSVCASAISFVLLQYATLRLPSAKVMAYTYLVPTWVIVWELARNGVNPNASILGGVVLSVTALLLLLKDESIEGKSQIVSPND